MRVQQQSIIMGAVAAAARAVQEVEDMAAKVDGAPAGIRGGGGRGLYEGEEERPGRSELAYMQHKYTALDTRIIIITAATLVLLLAILFLNFFIRWAIRRFFLLHSQKPINPNKGLSKRQVQALPSFIYSSSKPPPNFSSPSYHQYPNFSHDLKPHTCHFDNFDDNLKPISSHSCHHDLLPTKFYSTKVDASINSKLDEVGHNPQSQLGSTKVDKVDKDSPSKFSSLKVDEVIKGSKPHVVANDANSIIASNKANVLIIDSEVKANSTTFKGDNPIIGCTRGDDHGDGNVASSPAPCPICLVDYADGDTIRLLPTCRHFFHIGCIDIWLAKNSSCPACRANILEATKTPIKQPPLQVQVIITTSL